MRKNKNVKSNKFRQQNDIILRKMMIGIIILTLGILLGAISYTAYKVHDYKNNVIEYKIINTEAQVVPTGGGLNGDKDAMRFGKLGLGSSGNRYIDINSSYYAMVKIYVAGDMARFLSVENNTFYVRPGDNLHVPVYINIPMNTPLGNYTGQVHVLMLRS